MEEKNLKIDKQTGTGILLGSVIIGVIIVYSAYQDKILRQLKRSAKRRLALTDVDLYDKKDRKKIRKMRGKSLRKIEKARNKNALRTAVDRFEDSVDAFRTKPAKLADEKLEAVEEAYETLLRKGATAGASDAAKEFADAVRNAASSDQVRKLRKAFLSEAEKLR